MIIAFDVDGCLIDLKDKPRKEIVALVQALSKDNHIIVWSGCGTDYAAQRVFELGINQFVHEIRSKTDAKLIKADIAFDDQDVKLAKFNIKV